ncbi:MAG: hypothetical protein HY367_03430 [Candidatus Aenigmarchaeota archaeon]|nr:hypothetical protein [Candidatus Aenigmarchaeota archaeon]
MGGFSSRRTWKVCAICGSSDVTFARTASGWLAAQSYMCKDCGYVGPLVVEIDSMEEKERMQRRYRRLAKKGVFK